MAHSVTPLAAEIAAIAAREHGIVDSLQLARAGVARSTTVRWVESRRLFRTHHRVYSIVPPSMLSQEGRWLAAVKAAGPLAVLSHGPSGQLQGIVSRRHRYALDVSLMDRRRVRVPGILVHRPRNLEPRDVMTRLGIPTTNATRTVWDMSFNHSPTPVRRAFEKAERSGWLSRDRLRTLSASSPNRRGSGLIRELLADRIVPLSEVRSWLEELLVTICGDGGIPFPAVDVPLLGYEIDFVWERARFVVEADGGDHLDPTRRDRDNARDIALGRAGFMVRRYSYRAMNRRDAVAAEILEILRERGQLR